MLDFLKPKLIIDLGVNHGEDSEYYLRKGFRVVGVEANPLLAAEVEQSLKPHIQSGRFTLLNIGIWDSEGILPFYRNLHSDDWSSFDETYGCREGTPFDVIEIPTQKMDALFDRFGVPYYLKIDIEGADKHVLASVREAKRKPRYLSIEEYGVQAVDDLREAGYSKFYLARQSRKSPAAETTHSREGRAAPCTFGGRHSGVFGRDITEWMPYDEFRRHFTSVRGTEPGEWYDIHATF